MCSVMLCLVVALYASSRGNYGQSWSSQNQIGRFIFVGYHKAGWCALDLGAPGGSGGGLQQDPGSMASSLSGGMRSGIGPVNGQTHGPVLWRGQYLQRLGMQERAWQTEKVWRLWKTHNMFSSINPSWVVIVVGIRFHLAKGLQAATGCNVHYTPQGEAVGQKKTTHWQCCCFKDKVSSAKSITFL